MSGGPLKSSSLLQVAREPSGGLGDGEAPLRSLSGLTLGGRYRVGRLLAQGGMGAVYAGRHLLLDTDVAIKVVPLSARADAEERFLQEGRLACQVRHDNLVPIFDCGIVGDRLGYLIMELLAGRTLAELLGDDAMDVLRVCRVALQIARGLRAMHDKGVIHCDMKPRNVVLVAAEGEADRIKIVDFGIARAAAIADPASLPPMHAEQRTGPHPTPAPPTHDAEAASLRHTTSTAALAGTPPYMSPEQCLGQPLDGRSDMYALGCMMFEMLTGRAPFSGATPAEIMDAHLTAAVPPLRLRQEGQFVSPSLEQLVLRLLAKAPELRFPSMQQVELQLQREVDLLSMERGDTVVWSRDQLRRFVDSQKRWRKPQIGNSVLLRRMVALVIAMMSVRFGQYMRPVLPPALPLPRPPHLEVATAQKAARACTSPRRADTAAANAAPACENDQPPALRER